MGRKLIDITGQTFGRLTVVANTKRSGHWLCRCECGTEKVIYGTSLRSGDAKSCGCYNLERLSELKTTHGMRRTRFYGIYTNMLTRCRNENSPRYQDYGGRGITVCDRWLTFENFAADMLESYNAHAAEHGEKQTTIERIDNDSGYSPDNCRWSNRTEQNRNQRMRRTNTSGYTGVKRTQFGKWSAQISVDGQRKCLGTFASLARAVEARKQAEETYWTA